MKLYNKTAVITGASQGLGKAIATEFVKEGANVIICARNVNQLTSTQIELIEISHPRQSVFVIQADISNKNDMDKLYKTSIHQFGKIDILVNNAGIQGPSGLLENIDYNEWINSFYTNLFGVVYMCKIFIPHFKSNKYGKIINLSGGGAANPRAYFTAYSTAKAAVVRFTESIAEELKSYNIDANCISPGAMNTKLFEEVLSRGPDSIGKEYYEKALKQKESGGVDPSIAAKLCVFLASEESNGLTGKLISSIWDDWKDIPNHFDEIKTNDIYTLRRILPSDKGYEWGEIK